MTWVYSVLSSLRTAYHQQAQSLDHGGANVMGNNTSFIFTAVPVVRPLLVALYSRAGQKVGFALSTPRGPSRTFRSYPKGGAAAD